MMGLAGLGRGGSGGQGFSWGRGAKTGGAQGHGRRQMEVETRAETRGSSLLAAGAEGVDG